MAAVANSLHEIQNTRIEELLNDGVDTYLCVEDPIWANTMTTSMGAIKNGMGRDYYVNRTFLSGLTGIVEQGFPHGDVSIWGDTTTAQGDFLHLQNLTQTWPDATKGGNQTPYRLTIPMRSMNTNLMMTLGEMRTELNEGFIGEILAPKINGHSKYIVKTICNSFYTSQTDSYKLAGISSGSDTGSGPYYLTFTPDNESYSRFTRGMKVDIYKSDFTKRRNSTSTGDPATATHDVWVDDVDGLKGIVKLVSTTYDFDHGAGGNDGDTADTDVVVHANSGTAAATPVFTNFAGLHSYHKTGSGGAGDNTSIILGAESVSTGQVDVTEKSEHKSGQFSLGNQPLTEHKFRQIITRFNEAKREYDFELDTFIASQGAWLAFEGTRMGRQRFDMSNRMDTMQGRGYSDDQNFGGFKFTCNGRDYDCVTSTYVESGTIWGTKRGGKNWCKHLPKTIEGSPDEIGVDVPYAPFKFIGHHLNGGSAKMPIYDTSGNNSLVTEACQIPGEVVTQFSCKQMAGVKMVNVTEDRTYADY